MTTNYWNDPLYSTARSIHEAMPTSYVTTSSDGSTTVHINEMVNDLVDRKMKGEDIVSEKKEKTIKNGIYGTFKKVPKEFQIKQVIFNENKNATTVLFKDGKHIVVKKSENDGASDIYDVVAYAIAKKIYGTNSAFKKALKEKTTLIANKKKIKVDPDTLEV